MRHGRVSRESKRQQVLQGRAWVMRRDPTPSEARLFEAVRGGRLGVSFRRQVTVLGRYIVDLLVPKLKLVVEVDGGYHAQRERADERRDRALAAAGYRVVRVPAELVMRDLQAAVAVVVEAVEAAGLGSTGGEVTRLRFSLRSLRRAPLRGQYSRPRRRPTTG